MIDRHGRNRRLARSKSQERTRVGRAGAGEESICALEEARANRLAITTTAATQCVYSRYTERHAEAGIETSVGSRSDSCETRPGPLHGDDDVEFATTGMDLVVQPPPPIGYVPPAEHAEALYRPLRAIERYLSEPVPALTSVRPPRAAAGGSPRAARAALLHQQASTARQSGRRSVR